MTMSSKFPGRCERCGIRFAAGTPIEWSRVNRKPTHASEAACRDAQIKAAQAAEARGPAPKLDGAPIAAFLLAARDRGLKFPSVRFLAVGGGEMRCYVAGPRASVPGSIQVKVRGSWLGRIQPDGVVYGPLADDSATLEALAAIAADPAAAARAYGALMGRCSFCDRALTDEGSVEVGYGPICAAHYGLPHTPRGSRNLEAAGVVALAGVLASASAGSLNL